MAQRSNHCAIRMPTLVNVLMNIDFMPTEYLPCILTYKSHSSYALKSTPKSSVSYKWVILKGKIIFGII